MEIWGRRSFKVLVFERWRWWEGGGRCGVGERERERKKFRL